TRSDVAKTSFHPVATSGEVAIVSPPTEGTSAYRQRAAADDYNRTHIHRMGGFHETESTADAAGRDVLDQGSDRLGPGFHPATRTTGTVRNPDHADESESA